MAIMHRNPMPLSGALFVTNPRRRKNARKRRNGLSTRRNALAQRRNALAKLRNGAKKKKRNPTRRRRNAVGLGTSAEAVQKATKAELRTALALGGKTMTDKKFRATKKDALVKMALKALKPKPKRKSASSGSRKKSDWNTYLKLIKGASLTNAQAKKYYAEYKKDKKATRKKISAIKRKVHTKGTSIKRSTKRGSVTGRRFLRQGKDALLASGELVLNPFKKRNPRRRRNQGIMGIQPLDTALGAVEGIQAQASKIPVVRFASFAITPIALGASVYAVHKMAEPHIMKFLEQDLKVQDIPVLKETLKFPYTVTGIVAGLALGLLAKKNILDPQSASMVAASAVSVGIGLDLSLRSFAKAASQVASQNIADAEAVMAVEAAEAIEDIAIAEAPMNGEAPAMAGIHQMGAIHQNPHCYGDGGQYMIGRSSMALGNYGALHMGSATGLVKDPEYQDASPADAKACTCIMTPDEVSAAKAGKAAFLRKFGKSPRNMKRKQNLMSRHAGRAGHRYGWLIKMIGFENFQQIASLPPKRRATVISQLQKQAIASIPALIEAQAQKNSSLETASLPVAGTLNGVQGFEGVGYGALMFAGSGY